MRLLHHCPTIWCSRQRLQTEETAINLFIDISEVQQVAIASLLPYILVQSPTRTNTSEFPDVIPADAGIARRVKKLSPVPFDCALRQA
jgi:hypothetical protein